MKRKMKSSETGSMLKRILLLTAGSNSSNRKKGTCKQKVPVQAAPGVQGLFARSGDFLFVFFSKLFINKQDMIVNCKIQLRKFNTFY